MSRVQRVKDGKAAHTGAEDGSSVNPFFFLLFGSKSYWLLFRMPTQIFVVIPLACPLENARYTVIYYYIYMMKYTIIYDNIYIMKYQRKYKDIYKYIYIFINGN